MRWLLVLVLAGCGSSSEPAKPKPAPVPKAAAWRVPAGWKSETIPFPLDFAPDVKHTGVEELRFPPGFFKADQPDYWSYAFVWRTTDAAQLDAKQLGDEVTAYFKGLIGEVAKAKKLTVDGEKIVAIATANGARFDLTATVYDAFGSGQEVKLAGWTERTGCGTGAIWVFVLAPEKTTIRGELDALATEALTTCDRG